MIGWMPVADAGTLAYGIDAGVGESDNVTLSHNDRISQTIAVTDFDVDYTQKSQRLNVDAKGNFSYLDYLQSAYSNQLLGRFDGTAELSLIPQRLTWSAKENFGEAAIDPFTPTTPTNLEKINVFSTGPDLYLRLGGAGFLDMSARVARAQYEISPFSNSRTLGSIAWGLKLSPFSTISLNSDTQRVYFENTVLNTDFDRSNLFVRYDLQGERTGISADLGATIVGENGTSVSGSLAKFRLTRKISASTRLIFSLGHDFTDGGTNFSGLERGASAAVGTAPATNTSQNYTSTYASAGWDYRRNRTTLALSGRWEKDGYPGQPMLDRTMISGELRLQRQLTREFALQAIGTVYKSDYDNATVIATNASPNNILRSAIVSLTWRPGRALELKMAYEHAGYTTSPHELGYEENRVFLTVGYRPFRASPVGEGFQGF